VDPKVAAVISSLGPGFASKPLPKAPASRPSAHASPGLGEKMRSETSRAIESGLSDGQTFTTGLEKAVKAAAETVAALPTAQAVTPHPLAQAARALPGQLQALPGHVWGAAKRPLALGALGAAGALAYGMHQQNQHDRENQQLVYAPLQGAMM
jgi:hypothetical protein